MTTRETRQAVPLGSLTSDLRTVAALCRQRMRSRGRSIRSWLMWADDSGNVYFSDADDCATAALCGEAHLELGNGKLYTQAERRAQMDRYIVDTLIQLVRAGKVGVIE